MPQKYQIIGTKTRGRSDGIKLKAVVINLGEINKLSISPMERSKAGARDCRDCCRNE